MRLAARLSYLHDLTGHLVVTTGEERAAVDHHVDLIGAGLDRAVHVVQPHRQRILATGETGRDRGDLHGAAPQRFARHSHQ
jgi:hypothetical protein